MLYAFAPRLKDKEITVNDGMYNTVRVEPFIIGWGGWGGELCITVKELGNLVTIWGMWRPPSKINYCIFNIFLF